MSDKKLTGVCKKIEAFVAAGQHCMTRDDYSRCKGYGNVSNQELRAVAITLDEKFGI